MKLVSKHIAAVSVVASAFAGIMWSSSSMAYDPYSDPTFCSYPQHASLPQCATTARQGTTQIQSTQSLNLSSTISSAIANSLSNRPGGQIRPTNSSGLNETGRAAAGYDDKLNVWGALGTTTMAFKYAPAQSAGGSTLGLVGADYLFAPDMLAGAVLSVDENRIGYNPTGVIGRADGRGYMLSPYLAWQLNRNWLLDASVGIGSADMNMRNNAAIGNTKDKRSSASVSASYVTRMGNMDLTGKASLINANNKTGAFVDSAAVLNSEVVVRTTQVRVGGQASYGQGTLVPYAGVYYVVDTDRQIIAGAANDRDAFQVALGLNIFTKGSLSGGIMYATETGRSQIKNDQLIANIAVRF